MNARGDMADMLGTAQSSGQDSEEHSLVEKMGLQRRDARSGALEPLGTLSWASGKPEFDCGSAAY